MSSISILITRNENSKSDDVIRIMPVVGDSTSFEVSYTDVEDVKKNKFLFKSNAYGVRTYLNTTLNLLAKDDVPFQRLQFNIPAYPRIMVNMDKLEDEEFMDALWRAIDSVCEDWPTEVTENVVNTHVPGGLSRYDY
jgi:hypothetical protein